MAPTKNRCNHGLVIYAVLKRTEEELRKRAKGGSFLAKRGDKGLIEP
jgi:hypothetical protein